MRCFHFLSEEEIRSGFGCPEDLPEPWQSRCGSSEKEEKEGRCPREEDEDDRVWPKIPDAQMGKESSFEGVMKVVVEQHFGPRLS